jgi:ketosteroid isomerase-like protein
MSGRHEIFVPGQVGFDRGSSYLWVDRIVSGDGRNDYGYYTIIGRSPEGNEHRSRGKFAKVWVRGRDGVWRIRSDTYSSAPNP